METIFQVIYLIVALTALFWLRRIAKELKGLIGEAREGSLPDLAKALGNLVLKQADLVGYFAAQEERWTREAAKAAKVERYRQGEEIGLKLRDLIASELVHFKPSFQQMKTHAEAFGLYTFNLQLKPHLDTEEVRVEIWVYPDRPLPIRVIGFDAEYDADWNFSAEDTCGVVSRIQKELSGGRYGPPPGPDQKRGTGTAGTEEASGGPGGQDAADGISTAPGADEAKAYVRRGIHQFLRGMAD